ncbi:MAG: hypothetical protein KGI71_00985, partial [Patescibacteria group bacterium]|nr:hypothetical protein [Patescibacteria group bacterium]
MNMSRLTPYLGIVAALVLGAFVVALPGRFVVPRVPPSVAPAASPTISASPASAAPPATATDSRPDENKTTVAASSTDRSTPPAAPKKAVASPPAAQPVPAPIFVPKPPEPGETALDVSAATLRGALVNIICYVPAGSGLHSISGSGVFIDPKGIILTNAHIAQYFLLADRGVSCVVRSGSPAVSRYTAALAYISPSWIHTNASVLTQASPSGTGEYDFALLAINKSITSDA